MTDQGVIDYVSFARLLAWFTAAGCKGVVLAGTNGEGPSLSAPEKRNLIEAAQKLGYPLDLILGIASSSLDEAKWLCKQASAFGGSAALVMPPAYFKIATETGIRDWYFALLDASPVPLLVYNFPKMTGFTFSAELMGELAQHPNMAGLKDSSGEPANLASYRAVTTDRHVLFVGDETLLADALRSGWTGTISGASNVVAQWLVQIVAEWPNQRESAETKFEMLRPVLASVRQHLQPASHKAMLHAWDVLATPMPRLPLQPATPESVADLWAILEERLGITRENPGLPIP